MSWEDRSDEACEEQAPVTVWYVSAEPVDGNNEGFEDSKNEGGVAVYITDGDRKREVGRVGYKRRHTVKPHKRFKAALRDEVSDAEAAVEVMNDLERRARDWVRSARLVERQLQDAAAKAMEAARIAEEEAAALVVQAREKLNAAAAAVTPGELR